MATKKPKPRIKIGDEVDMPDPDPKFGDAWHYGGFCAKVVDIRESGNLVVEDQDSDFFEVEPERVRLVDHEATTGIKVTPETMQEYFGAGVPKPKPAKGLPNICYGLCPAIDCAILIKKGEKGYWRSGLPATEDAVNEFNGRLGVTAAQRMAMEYGSMFGWDVPAADPVECAKMLEKTEKVSKGRKAKDWTEELRDANTKDEGWAAQIMKGT